MLLRPLTSFEIQKYYQNEPKFNGFYSRNIFLKNKKKDKLPKNKNKTKNVLNIKKRHI